MAETLLFVLRWQGQRLGTGPDELERAAPGELECTHVKKSGLRECQEEKAIPQNE